MSEFRIYGSEFRIKGTEFRIYGSEFRNYGFAIRMLYSMSLGFAPCGSLSLNLGVLNVDFRICHLVVGCYPQRFGSLLQRCFHEVGVILEKLLVIYSKPGKARRTTNTTSRRRQRFIKECIFIFPWFI